MRRSNYIVGFGLSALAHVFIVMLLVRSARSGPAPTPAPTLPAPTPVQIASVDPAEMVPLAPMSAAPAPDDGVTAEGGEEEEPTIEPLAIEPPAPERHLVEKPRERVSPPLPAPASPPSERVAMRPTSTPAAPIIEAAPDPIEVAEAQPTERIEAETAPPPSNPIVAAPSIPTPRSLVGHTMIRAPRAEPPPVVPEREPSNPGAAAAKSAAHEGDRVPPLRVYWGSASELLTVARALGMRLAAVDHRGDIIGEVDLSRQPALRSWPGLPFGYSNRVRMLSPSIFSAGIHRQGSTPSADIAEIWIFVPADRDRSMVREQRDAVRRAGVRPEDVVAVDGQFVRALDGSYELRITNVHARTGGAS